jgi:hypothetical protein
MVHTASAARVPFDTKFDCCPVSLPAMLTRSTITPGTARISANGSRDVGILVSSSAVKFVAVPVARGSTTGDCSETVTVSLTPATFNVTGISTCFPTSTTIRSCTTVVKPESEAVSTYAPGARFGNRKRPSPSVTTLWVTSAPRIVTVTPGSITPV